ncbi:hypothetical protein [Microvirga terricola]|nr:hypothetical protein [Microvirga terricola]
MANVAKYYGGGCPPIDAMTVDDLRFWHNAGAALEERIRAETSS